MGYKVKRGIKKYRKKFIVIFILLIIITVLFTIPLSIAIQDAINTENYIVNFIESISNNITSPIKNIGLVFTSLYINTFFKTFLIVSGLFLLFMIIGIVKAMPKHEYDYIEHGSSEWCENGEQYRVLDNKKGILLAEKHYLPTDKRGNINVLVVGGSGSGKSASYSIPNAYQELGSYIFTDPKGELYDKTAGYLRERGYEIKVFNLANPKNSDGYNPLMHINSEIDVDVIANTIVKGQSDLANKSDPYWDDMAEMLLKALIYFLIATRPEEEQNLSSCAELVRAANANTGDNLLTNLMNQLPYDHPARMNYKSIEIASDKTYSSILSSLQSKLGKFDSKEITELTATDTISFEEIGQKKTAVYVISSDTHSAYDFLLTIFFSQMIQQMYDFADKNGGALPMPTYFILDEFANIGKIPSFDKKISTSRSRKISFSVILQNLDQLESVYKDTYETIIGNCDTHIFLGSNSQKTVEYFSKQLGEKTIVRDNVSINKDKNDWKQGKTESDQIMARALLTPDELRRLDTDLCIIYEKGLKPIKARKYYYFEYSTAKYSKIYPADHNIDINVDRGTWRKYNPYNPYKDNNDIKQNDTKIESLDDLFEDEKIEIEKEVIKENPIKIIEEEKEEKVEDRLSDDLQKELEAKFDELFGSVKENE